jgi:hypothetical protein
MTISWEKKICENHVALIFTNSSKQITIFSEQHLQEMKMCTAIILNEGIYNLQNIPENIKALCINQGYISTPVPNHISILCFGGFHSYNDSMQNLPIELKDLSLECLYDFNGNLDMLPSKLEILSLNTSYSQELNNLPVGLKILSISAHYPHQLRNLPKTIEEIKITDADKIFADGEKIGIYYQVRGKSKICSFMEDLHNYQFISFNKKWDEVILKLP